MFDPIVFCEKSSLELVENVRGKAVALCPKERLETTMLYLKNHLGFAFLSAVYITVERETRYAFYWLEKVDGDFNLGLKTPLHEGDVLNASLVFPSAESLEAEALGRSQLKLERDVQWILKRIPNRFKKPASVEADQVDETVDLEIPFSSSLNPFGLSRALVPSLEDKALRMELFFGDRRSGFERALNHRTSKEVANDLLKYAGFDGFLYSLLFIKALEEGNGVNPPDKAQAIRMIFLELFRILKNLEFCAGIALENEAQTLYFKCLRWSEEVLDLIRLYTGNDFCLGLATYGGVNKEPPANWISLSLDSFSELSEKIIREAEGLSRDMFWKRSETLGKLDKEILLKWGVTGASIRASGVNYDMRRIRPYYLYDEVEFESPIGINGALFDRLIVRLSEASESVKIVTQLLDNLPSGRLVAKEIPHFSNIPRPAENEAVYRESIDQPWGVAGKDYYACLEGPEGFCSIGFSIAEGKTKNVALGSPEVFKVHCLEEAAKGLYVEDLSLFVKSMNINQRALEKSL